MEDRARVSGTSESTVGERQSIAKRPAEGSFQQIHFLKYTSILRYSQQDDFNGVVPAG